MATWKQENIMLTKVGEKALASAEAGTGKITITKIVGSDFNPSDIYNTSSTSAINNNLVFNIVEKKPVDSTTGTTIVIQATNKNVTAKFKMNSIVVFATQSSISSGEFPYMIAKTLNADEVDIPTNTPVTLNFSLTILNTRGGLLNLTISNTGFVPIPTYLVDMQDYQNNVNAFGVTSGSAVTQRISSQFLNDHPITLKDGVSVKVKLGYNLKANSTLNVAGTGDKQILDVTGNTIPDDTFTQGSMLNLMYDTARNAWIVIGGEVLTASNGIQKVGKDMQLVDRGVLTKHIKDLNVTTAKLADKSVTPEKLSDDSLNNILVKMYPIGSIYTSVVETNPANLFGFGTWESLPEGRMLLAQGSNYIAGSTGGEATHTLTASEMPRHNHYSDTEYAGNHNHTGSTNSNGNHSHNLVKNFGNSPDRIGRGSYINKDNSDDIRNIETLKTTDAGNHSHTFTTTDNGNHTHRIKDDGGSQPHNNMPPYLSVYMWKRIA